MNHDAMVQATGVALGIDADGPLIGVALLGRPGAGKTALALALIEACVLRRTRLIGDDGLLIAERDHHLIASAPPAIAGLVEIRGTGLAAMRGAGPTRLRLAAEVGPAASRLPPARVYAPLGPEGPVVPKITWDERRGPVGFISCCRSLGRGHSGGLTLASGPLRERTP